MAKKALEWISPAQSPAHRELRRQIGDAGLPVEGLRRMLWALNAHPELIAFPQICESLQGILALLPTAWEINPLREWGLDEWPVLLEWILAHRVQLTEAIGPKFNRQPTKKSRRNPILGEGATRHPLYAALWHTHEDPAREERYRLLQGQLLVACLTALTERHKGHLEESYTAYEQYDQGEEWEALPNSPGAAARAVRYFSALIDAQGELFDRYPVDLPPPRFTQRLARISPSDDRTQLLRHDSLKVFLWHVFSGQWRQRGSFQKGGIGERKWVEGYVKLTDGTVLHQNLLGDPEDPDADWGGQVIGTACRGTTMTLKDLVEIDEHPYEQEEEDEIFLTDYGAKDKEKIRRWGDRTAASQAQVKHVEMANQLLPWAYPVLSDGEVRSLIDELNKRQGAQVIGKGIRRVEKGRGKSEWDEFEVLTFLHVMISTGSSLEQTRNLKVFFDGTANEDAELALFVDGDWRDPQTCRARWRLRALEPEYKQIQESIPTQERPRNDYFFLPCGSGIWLLCFLSAHQGYILQRTAEQKESDQSGHPLPPECPQALRCFPRPVEWYRRRIQKLLLELDPTGRLTSHKVSGWLFSRLVQQTGGDVAAAALITGRPHPIAHVRRYYATPSVSELQTVYANSVSGAGILPSPYASASLPSHGSIGSRLCPTLAAVAEAVRGLQEQIEVAADYSDDSAWTRYHNLYTLYSVWSFAYGTGVRGITTPYLDGEAVDSISGFSRLGDKDSGTGYKIRLPWIPPSLAKQMAFYRRHLKAVRLEVDGAEKVIEEPCFLLEARHKAVAVSPETMKPLMKEFLPFPANVHRRFVRTELLSRRCSPEIVDSWMGHWYCGEEPWGDYSCFSFHEYRRELERHLSPLLQELGFRPVRSRLR